MVFYVSCIICSKCTEICRIKDVYKRQDYILMHTAHDMLIHDSAPIDDLKYVKSHVKHAKVGISGGISPEQMPEIMSAAPDWVVVGSALYMAEDPLAVARAIHAF